MLDKKILFDKIIICLILWMCEKFEIGLRDQIFLGKEFFILISIKGVKMKFQIITRKYAVDSAMFR